MQQAVTHFFILNDEELKPYSGAENHLWELLKGLSKFTDVELLLSVGNTGDFINAKINELIGAGVTVNIIKRYDISPKVNAKYLRIYEECKFYYTEFKKRRNRILHLHLNTNIIPLSAILAGHKKIVYSFHNDLPTLSDLMHRVLLGFLVSKFKHCIAITHHVKKHLVENVKLPAEKITVIHYGINPPPIVDVSDLNFNAPHGSVILGFVGRLDDGQKNIFFLVDCIKELNGVYLVLLGDGPDKIKLQNYVTEIGIQDRVHFHGYLNNASSFMNKFDFLCLPSKWEGLGLVLIEAMYQKVPIIGSSAGAIPEILVNGELGTIISADNKEHAIKTIKATIHDLPLAIEKADKAYSFALQYYSVDSMVKKTIQVYNLCVE
jgi:glycosyltransferase involved in cell wall biosynthesis